MKKHPIWPEDIAKKLNPVFGRVIVSDYSGGGYGPSKKGLAYVELDCGMAIYVKPVLSLLIEKKIPSGQCEEIYLDLAAAPASKGTIKIFLPDQKAGKQLFDVLKKNHQAFLDILNDKALLEEARAQSTQQGDPSQGYADPYIESRASLRARQRETAARRAVMREVAAREGAAYQARLAARKSPPFPTPKDPPPAHPVRQGMSLLAALYARLLKARNG